MSFFESWLYRDRGRNTLSYKPWPSEGVWHAAEQRTAWLKQESRG